MSFHDVFLLVASGSLIASVVILIVLWRLVAAISENVIRIETWTSELLRKVAPKNPLVCADHLSPFGAACRSASTLHLALRIDPASSKLGELE